MEMSLGSPSGSGAFLCNGVAAGDALKDEVKEKLAAALHGHHESLQNPENKAKAIVICPYQKIEGQPSTGSYMVDAVCDFFSLDKATMKTQDAHGFIVKPVSGDVQLLRWGGDGKARASDGDFDSKDLSGNFPEEVPGKYGWAGLDHTNEREWSALWSRGRWVRVDPAKAIGPGPGPGPGC